MAGILVGVSAMTGAKRLRNMKHEPGGPFWVEREGTMRWLAIGNTAVAGDVE